MMPGFRFFGALVIILLFSWAAAFAQDKGDWFDAQVKDLPIPDYPEAAKAAYVGGKVVVTVSIDSAGNVTSVEDVSGPDWVCPSVTEPGIVALREAARAAALRAKFTPATSNGKAVRSRLRINYFFDASRAGPESPTAAKPVVIGERTEIYAAAPSGPAAGVINGGVVNGRARSLPKPAFPPAARAVGASGVVEVRVGIDEQGNVFSAEAISGHPFLRVAARNAACDATFLPTQLEGKPVRVSGIITYNFVP